MYIRTKVTSVGVGVNWVGNFALTFFTPPAFQNIQWRVGLVTPTERWPSLTMS